MELTAPALIALATVSFILSFSGFLFALFAFIETQAQKRSTHTVLPISNNDSSLQKLEKQINDITGQGGSFNALNRDLNAAGLDVDELV